MRMLIVFAALMVLAPSAHAQFCQAAWGGAHVGSTLKTGVAPDEFYVTFTPATALVADDKITITADKAIFKADGDSKADTTMDQGGAKVVKASAISGGKKVNTITSNGAIAAGTAVVVTIKSATVLPAAGAVVFDIETSKDKYKLTGQTGFSVLADGKPTAASIAATTTLGTGVKPGGLTFKYTTTYELKADATVILTSDKGIFKADGATTATTIKCGSSSLATKSSAISGGAGKVLTITANAQCDAGSVVEVVAGDADLIVSPAAGDVTVGIKSGSADELTGTKYAIVAAAKVVWTSFAASPDKKQGNTPTSLKLIFKPTTALAAADKITLTANKALYASDAAATATATCQPLGGTKAALALTSSTISGTKTVNTIVVNGACPPGATIEYTQTTNIGVTPLKSAGAITMSIETSKDATAITGQAAYTPDDNSVTFNGASVKASLMQAVSPAEIYITFTPKTALAADSKITITSDGAIFKADGDSKADTTMTQGGTAKVVKAAAISGGAKKVNTITSNGAIDAGTAVIVKYVTATVNPNAADIKFKFLTSDGDKTETALAKGYATVAAKKVLAQSVTPATLAGGVAPKITVKVTIQTALAADGTMTFESDQEIFKASGTDAATAKCGSAALTVKTTANDANKKKTVVTVGGDCNAGSVVAVTLVTEKKNPSCAALVVKMKSVTSVDDTATAVEAGYTTLINQAQTVKWTSAKVATSLVTGQAPGNLEVKFQLVSSLGSGDKMTITASKDIFAAAAATTAGATCGGAALANTAAASDKKTLVVTLSADCAVNAGNTHKGEIVLTVSSNLGNNPAAGAVTFDVQTTADTKLSAQTGYTVVAAKSVAWGGAYPATSLVQGQATGALTVKFTPATALAVGDTVTITPSAQLFKANDANNGKVVTTGLANSVGAAGAVPGTAVTCATTRVLIVKGNAVVLPGVQTSVIVDAGATETNPNAAAVTFGISTSKDTTALATQTGYTTVAAKSVKWTGAVVNTLVTGKTPTSLKVTFTPSTSLANTNTFKLTADKAIFGADGAVADTGTCGGATLGVTGAISGGGGLINTVTVGAACLAGKQVIYTQTDKLKFNPAAGAVKFSIETTGDSVALTAQTGYTTTAGSVMWVGAATAADADIAGFTPTTIKVTFTPATALAADDTIEITASAAIFKAAEGDSKANTEANNGGDILKSAVVDSTTKTTVTASGAAAAGTNIIVTLKGANIALNNAAGGAITFSIKTSKDTTALTGQTGYTLKTLTWGGAQVKTSLVTGQSPEEVYVTFTPATALAADDTITITADKAVFKADGDSKADTTMDQGGAKVVKASAVSGTKTKCIITSNGAVAKAAAVTVTIKTTTVNLAAGDVKFSIETSKDTASGSKLSAQTGYTNVAAKSVTWGGAAPQDTLAAAVTPTKILVTFTPNTAIAADGVTTITASTAIFKDAGDTKADFTVTNTGAKTAFVRKSAATTSTTVATVTSNAATTPGKPIVLTMGGARIAVNPAAGAVTFKIKTAGDTVELTGQTGYTTVAAASVTWGKADITEKQAGKSPGTLKVTFTKLASIIAANDFITLTANKAIFAAGCTATTLANVKCGTTAMAVDAGNTKTTSTSELVIKVTGTCAYGTKSVSFDVTSNLAVNPAAGAVTFSASTTKDSTAVTAQTGYTTTAPPTPPAGGGGGKTTASGSASAAAGGKTYTSGASSYASGKAPAPPASTTKHFVVAQVKLSGITKAQFDAAAKTAFKEVIATGITGAVAADVTITAITDARRAGIKVDFKVQVKDKAAATAGATKLNTFLTTGTQFKDALVAKGGNLAKVTGTEVTIAPKATTESTVSGVANTAAMSLISMVAAGLALLR